MRALTKFVLKDVKLNRKRSIGILIGITLSVMLICTVTCIVSSYSKTMLQSDINYFGYWHISLSGIDEAKLEKLNLNRNVNMVKSVYNNYYQYTNQTTNKVDNFTISFMDEETFNYLKYQKLDGNYPQSEYEILVSKSFLKNINKKIGDEISLTEEHEDNIPSDSIDANVSQDKNTLPINYKIVGTYNGGYFDKTAISTNRKKGDIDAYVVLQDPHDYKDALANILEIEKFDYALYENGKLAKTKYIYELNSVLMDEVHPIESKSIQVTLLGVLLVIIIIVYTSIYSIRNSFSISQTEKLKMHGMFASIGATSKQLKNSMVLEGLILGIIGIPIGILLSIVVTYALVVIINSIQFMEGLNTHFMYSISWGSIFLSILLGFTTILLSTRRAARQASRVSPIDKLRSNTDIKSERKIKKIPKLIDKLFGIGGIIAYKNIKRSRKKYHTTVVALTTSVFMFITTSYLLKEDFKPMTVSHDYNIQIYPSATSDKKFDPIDIEKIYQLPNVEKMYYIDTIISSIYNSDNEKTYVYKLFNSKNEVIYQDLTYVALDDNTFKDYLQTLNLDYNNMKGKVILYIPKRELLDSLKTSPLDPLFSTEISLNVNDTFYGRIRSTVVVDDKDDEEIDDGVLYKFNIGYQTEKLPFDYVNSQGMVIPEERPIIFVNKTDYPTISFSLSSFINIKANDPNRVETQIEDININYPVINYYAEQQMMEKIALFGNIVLYSVISIISIIGITNIFNTITSNMNLRQKEFAILKSIGMTRKEFDRMINLEVLLYSFKSLFCGIFLSILVTYLSYYSDKVSDTSEVINQEIYKLPFIEIVISIIVVLAIVYMIMKFSINKINKQNIIETIRNDNI